MTEELKNFYPTPEEVIQIMTSKIEKNKRSKRLRYTRAISRTWRYSRLSKEKYILEKWIFS